MRAIFGSYLWVKVSDESRPYWGLANRYHYMDMVRHDDVVQNFNVL